ncbi:MAG: HEPN domain-containing protein [Defluviitaleaceae bacterium]|nr:HEPN domain-containing protein [Defluviitaleaceae bacterium]
MMTKKQHIDYWLHGATENIKDMKAAIKSKRRSMAMFCGHLAIEKTLKGLCAVRGVIIQREHKLIKLAKECGLDSTLTYDQREELQIITNFNIEARYDDYKMRFHATCTPQYVAEWSGKITTWYKELKRIILQERASLPNNVPDMQSLIK